MLSSRHRSESGSLLGRALTCCQELLPHFHIPNNAVLDELYVVYVSDLIKSIDILYRL